MKDLNTMNSFKDEGFKIERDGKVIILTSEEMYEFRYMEAALNGYCCLECHLNNLEEDNDIVEKMMSNEDTCYNIENEILDTMYQDSGSIELEVIKDYIKKYKAELTNNKVNDVY